MKQASPGSGRPRTARSSAKIEEAEELALKESPTATVHDDKLSYLFICLQQAPLELKF